MALAAYPVLFTWAEWLKVLFSLALDLSDPAALKLECWSLQLLESGAKMDFSQQKVQSVYCTDGKLRPRERKGREEEEKEGEGKGRKRSLRSEPSLAPSLLIPSRMILRMMLGKRKQKPRALSPLGTLSPCTPHCQVFLGHPQ